MHGRREVLSEMGAALRLGRPPTHDGRWGKATLEVALAIQQSAKQRREIALRHQVPAPPPTPGPGDNLGPADGDVIVTARIVNEDD
jgi:hypothetical protein